MNAISGIRNPLMPPAMQEALRVGQGAAATGTPAAIAELGTIAIGRTGNVQGTPSSSFGDMLGGMVREVSDKQAQASSTVGAMLAGEEIPLHQAMIAMEEASVSFQLMVEVRNKLLESYQELMRMQI